MCVSIGPSEARTKSEVQKDEGGGQKEQEAVTPVAGNGEGRKEGWPKIALQREDYGWANGQSESRECLLGESYMGQMVWSGVSANSVINLKQPQENEALA